MRLAFRWPAALLTALALYFAVPAGSVLTLLWFEETGLLLPNWADPVTHTWLFLGIVGGPLLAIPAAVLVAPAARTGVAWFLFLAAAGYTALVVSRSTDLLLAPLPWLGCAAGLLVALRLARHSGGTTT